MIVEEWIGIPRTGADWQSTVKQSHLVLKRIGIPYRCYTEETGVIRRVHMYMEFASLTERDKFWAKLPSDFQPLVDKVWETWDAATFQHQYYNVFI